MSKLNSTIVGLLLPLALVACGSSDDDSQESIVGGNSAGELSSVNSGVVNSTVTADGEQVNNDTNVSLADNSSADMAAVVDMANSVDASSGATLATNVSTDSDSNAGSTDDINTGSNNSENSTQAVASGDSSDSRPIPVEGSSDAPIIAAATAADFGLTARASLANPNLPIEGEQLGNYALVNAYPNIQFQEALLVDDVPGENRLIVVEQKGRIKVFDDDVAVTEVHEILDYSDKVVFTGEQGLLGMAFDPDFVQNRYVYIYYTEKDTNRSIISRLVWNAATDVLERSSSKIILQVDQPYQSHNGGMIAFGPDNYLYIALGDGGDGGDPHNNGQDRSTLLANILRIDVHPADASKGYDIPASNPFVGEAGVRGEIYAYGFRNPWRFSFDRETGDLWLGDVGQEGFEEVNIVKAGGNYGWRVYEGSGINKPELNTLPESAFTFPVHEYPNAEGQSVIGGYVYRGSVSSLKGRYIFTDFTNGIVQALSWNGTRSTGIENVGTVDGPTSFGETRDGELLVVSRYEGLFKFAESVAGGAFPEQLSDTGLFSDLASLTTASGIIEYTPSHPFWSDGTLKRRWIGVPDDKKIEFTDNDWTFPVGTVSIKHFEIELTQNTPSSRRRLETRVMYHTESGWQGFTYRWNQNETDANIVRDGETETLSISMNDGSKREQLYEYPSRSACLQCHTQGSTFLLGLETGQLNTTFDFGATTDNQLRSYNNIGLFNTDIGNAEQYKVLPPLNDESATIESRARAYLDVNCSVCHQPGGSAPTTMDLRFETSNAGLNAIGVTPQAGSFNIENARIIAQGDQEKSILLHRMKLLEGGRMPSVSSHVVDEVAVELIGEWIDSLQ